MNFTRSAFRFQGRRETLKKDSIKKKTEGKEFKKKQKSQVDKFIGKLKVNEDGKKLPKGLPSHWGAKVRHNPRPATAATKKNQQRAVKRKSEETQVSSPQVKFSLQTNSDVNILKFHFVLQFFIHTIYHFSLV